MFCPLAVAWGNAADWAAAFASTLAVFAAVWIAYGQERNARKVRQRARDDAHQRGAYLVAEVIRLAGEIEAVANSGTRLVTLGGSNLSSHRDQIEGLRSQLRALQRYPHDDPRVFGEIGRIIHASEFSLDITQASTSYVSIIFREIAGRMADRRQALAGLQSRDLAARGWLDRPIGTRYICRAYDAVRNLLLFFGQRLKGCPKYVGKFRTWTFPTSKH